MRSRRRFGLLAMLAMAGALLVGCGALQPQVCPAIGWSNTLTIDVTPAGYEVAAVEVCVDDDCVSSAATSPSASSLMSFETREADTWRVSTVMQSPDRITLRFFDVAGELRDEQVEEVEWLPVGEPNPCGGPAAADVEIIL